MSHQQIYVITPYAELYELAKQCQNERSLNIKVKKGNLEEAISVARQAEQNGADALISRGGTATIVRKHVDIPVVEIKVTYVDILRALYPYKDSEETILIIGYENVVYGCQTLSKILNINIKEIFVPDEDTEYNWQTIQRKAQELICQYQIDTVIGDTVPISRLMTKHPIGKIQ